MAHKGSPDGYTVSTEVSIFCKSVMHKERDFRRLNGESDITLKEIHCEWLEEVAKKRQSTILAPAAG